METQNIINIVLVALCVFAIGLAIFGMGSRTTITGAADLAFDGTFESEGSVPLLWSGQLSQVWGIGTQFAVLIGDFTTWAHGDTAEMQNIDFPNLAAAGSIAAFGDNMNSFDCIDIKISNFVEPVQISPELRTSETGIFFQNGDDLRIATGSPEAGAFPGGLVLDDAFVSREDLLAIDPVDPLTYHNVASVNPQGSVASSWHIKAGANEKITPQAGYTNTATILEEPNPACI